MKLVIPTTDVPSVLFATLTACGHQVIAWDRGRMPVFDLFAKAKADMIILHPSHVDRAMMKCLAANPSLRAVLLSENPTAQDVELAATIQGSVQPWWPGADVFTYRPGRVLAEFKCDFAYWGDHIGDKTNPLLGLCYEHPGLNIKIFGRNWPVPQCLGLLDEWEVSDLYASAETVVCNDDTSFLNIAVAGGYPVVHLDNEILVGEARASYLANLRRDTFLTHTCFDSLIALFDGIGLEDQVPKVLAAKGEALKGRI